VFGVHARCSNRTCTTFGSKLTTWTLTFLTKFFSMERFRITLATATILSDSSCEGKGGIVLPKMMDRIAR
jgi:hypothetical protein